MKRLPLLLATLLIAALIAGCGASDGTAEIKNGTAAPKKTNERDEN